jgi:hypothetical protein
MVWHHSKLMIKRYKSLHVKDFNQAVLNSISDIKNVYKHADALFKVDPLLRHIYPDHVYNMVSHQSRVLHELQGLLADTGRRKAITHYVQVSSWGE